MGKPFEGEQHDSLHPTTSFDEATMSLFVSGAGTSALPVRMYIHTAEMTGSLVAFISPLLIVLTLKLMIILDRVFRLDRVLSSKA